MSEVTPEPQTRTTNLLRNTAIALVALLLVFLILERTGTFRLVRMVLTAARAVATYQPTVVDPTTLTWPPAPTVQSVFTTSPASGYTTLVDQRPRRQCDVDVAAVPLPSSAPFVLVIARPRNVPAESPEFFLDFQLGLVTRSAAGFTLPERTEPKVHMRITGPMASRLYAAPVPQEIYDTFSSAITQHKITTTLPYGLPTAAVPISLPPPTLSDGVADSPEKNSDPAR
jgi:hypothetical protein